MGIIKTVMKRCGNDMNLILDQMLNEEEHMTQSSSGDSNATHDSGLE